LEHRLQTETENPTIGWNQELTNFQFIVETPKPFNFLEGYFDIPESMIGVLQDDLQIAKQIDLVRSMSQLYKLHCLKTKLKNCLTPDLACDIETSTPTGHSNKERRFFSINIVSHTFPEKEAHTHIIYENMLTLERTELNNMEGFHR
jgi:hypothetical protein